MTVSDPIGDMLTRIRNGLMARHESIMVPASKTKVAIAEILKQEGFIRDFSILSGPTPQQIVRMQMAYKVGNSPVINGLRRVSKPGLRVYVQRGEIPRIFGGLGIAVVSTSNGVMTGRDAWRKGIGGELLAYVW
jgi:small subunit ribosomal protein S8